MNNGITLYDYSKRYFGKKRFFKEIEKKEFNFLFESSPLELLDCVSVYDIETFEYFLIIRFSKVTPKDIDKFSVRLFLYLDSQIPYKKLSFTYDVNLKKKDTDIIGEDKYIPIPQTYYKKYEIFIDEVVYTDGTVEKLCLSAADTDESTATEYLEQMDASFTPSYTGELFPAVVMPKFSEYAWICTCSQKNHSSDEICTKCSRTKASQMEMMKKYDTSEYEKDAYSLVERAKKADFIKSRNTEKPDAEKEKQIETEIDKVEKREKYKDKMKIQALPRLLIYIAAGYAIFMLLKWLESVI